MNSQTWTYKSAILMIALILTSHFIDCSHKIKSTSRLHSRLRKAGITIGKTSTGVDCSATSILGVDGNVIKINPTSLTPYMPSDFQSTWSILAPVISAMMPTGANVVYGDFEGSELEDNEDLGTVLCDTLPMLSDGTFGLIGGAFYSIP